MVRITASFIAVFFLCTRATSAIIVPTTSGFTSSERRVLDSAVDYWERLISDPLTVHVSFSKEALAGDLLGVSSKFNEGPNGLPLGGRVQIDNRAGSVIGWFVDPTPALNEEFLPGFTPYHRRGRLGTPAGENYDLLTVLNHELAHVLGFSVSYSRFQSHVSDADYGLREYHGSGVSAVLTPVYEGTHLNDAVHPYDLLDTFRSRGERVFPSDLDLDILSDAFGYRVGPPIANPVPEPHTLLSVAVGLLIVLIAARRHRPHYVASLEKR
jgi:hypothetical protein